MGLGHPPDPRLCGTRIPPATCPERTGFRLPAGPCPVEAEPPFLPFGMGSGTKGGGTGEERDAIPVFVSGETNRNPRPVDPRRTRGKGYGGRMATPGGRCSRARGRFGREGGQKGKGSRRRRAEDRGGGFVTEDAASSAALRADRAGFGSAEPGLCDRQWRIQVRGTVLLQGQR